MGESEMCAPCTARPCATPVPILELPRSAPTEQLLSRVVLHMSLMLPFLKKAKERHVTRLWLRCGLCHRQLHLACPSAPRALNCRNAILLYSFTRADLS